MASLAVTLWLGGLALAIVDRRPEDLLPGTGALAFALVGALVVLKRPANGLGPVLCAIGLLMAVAQTGGQYARVALVTHPGDLPAGTFTAWLTDTMALPIVGLFVGVLPQLFPDGRPYSRRWRYCAWAAFVFIACACIGNAFAAQSLESVRGMANPYALPSSYQPVLGALIVLSLPFGLVALGASAVTVVLRWRRALGDERQQLKWFAVGMAPVPIPLLLHDSVPVLAGALFSLLIPVAAATMGVAILRHRLYDLDLVVRRALGYAAVMALVAGLYLAVVAGVDAMAGHADATAHVAAAVVAAAAFHPLLVRCRSWVGRLFYGDRGHPYDAVAKLGVSLERALPPSDILPAVVQTVAETLRLPYVAIELADGEGHDAAASHGSPIEGLDIQSFDMTYQGEPVGRLLVSPRRTENALHESDRRVLLDLARHTGVAAHAVRTGLALQRSRAELVTAREEERRRLRRDLHDGLGPTLAGVTLGLHAAQTRIDRDPESARLLLGDLEAQVENAIQDIRRLVYQLRPPALDEFGLVRAVAMHAAHLEDGDLSVQVYDAEPIGRLPAAVEVAAYRIATEAMTNVSRHAGARHCTVSFTLNGSLSVEIADDGRGIATPAVSGVGLTAMRERTAELGGRLTVDSTPTGTVVTAILPVDET